MPRFIQWALSCLQEVQEILKRWDIDDVCSQLTFRKFLSDY